MAVIVWMIARSLSSAVEPIAVAGPRVGLVRSRATVTRLASLFDDITLWRWFRRVPVPELAEEPA